MTDSPSPFSEPSDDVPDAEPIERPYERWTPASPPVLAIRLSLSPATVTRGGSVTITAHVSEHGGVAHHAVLRFSASSATVTGPVALGDLSGERTVAAVVRVPAGHGTQAVVVTATITADRANARSATATLTVPAESGRPAKSPDLPITGSSPAGFSRPCLDQGYR